jgi:C4-dicarboxylate-specific signal transduction histidine kinase
MVERRNFDGNIAYDCEAAPDRVVTKNLNGRWPNSARHSWVQVERLDHSSRYGHLATTESERLGHCGSFLWTLESDDVVCSEEMRDIFEWDPHERITLERIRTHVHPQDAELINGLLERTRHLGADLDVRFRIRAHDRSLKYLRMVARPTRLNGLRQYMGAVQDETEKHQTTAALENLKAELARSVRVMSLGALTASITHEVRQPLSGIITNVDACIQMLESDPVDLDAIRQAARRALRDAHRACDVIARLRDMADRKPPKVERVDLNESIREVLTISLTEVRQRRVKLQLELDDFLPGVSVDRIQLQQVLINLILNAVEAMDEQDQQERRLTIRTERVENGYARAIVCDTGKGFNSQEIERVFEAFYTTKAEGMGLGLYVSRAIIENHGGCLQASPNPVRGATFSFLLPLNGD